MPVVFGKDDVGHELAAAGFTADVPTLVLWEGTTNYLDASSVDATFRFLAEVLSSGSLVLFTYVDRGMLDGSAKFAGAETTMRAVQHIGEPFTFGFAPTELASYLADRGFRLSWDETVADAARRLYAPGRCPTVPSYYHVVKAARL